MFGHRIADDGDGPAGRAGRAAGRRSPPPPAAGPLLREAARPQLQQLMSRDVGVLRDDKGLTLAGRGSGRAGRARRRRSRAPRLGDDEPAHRGDRAGPAAALRRRDPGRALARRLPRPATTRTGAGTSTPSWPPTARCAPTFECRAVTDGLPRTDPPVDVVAERRGRARWPRTSAPAATSPRSPPSTPPRWPAPTSSRARPASWPACRSRRYVFQTVGQGRLSRRVRQRRRRPGDAGRGAGHRARPDARPAHRRAHRAELPRPPVRRRDADPALGRRRRRAPARCIRDTRKTMPGLRALEKYAVRMRRRRQPPHVAVGRRAGQGQPRRRRRRRGAGVRAGAGALTRACRSRSRSTRSSRRARSSTPAPTSSCSTT